jgi:citrate lyase subunit gamma (acyl carrier protein)
VKAGSMESSDLVVIISEAKGLNVEINSIVKNQFGEQIKKLVMEIIEAHRFTDVDVLIHDRGALDYAIKARMETAISRYRKEV